MRGRERGRELLQGLAPGVWRRIPDAGRWLYASDNARAIFGFLVREYRLAIGMAMGDLARATGRTVCEISAIETGRDAPLWRVHKRIVEALVGADEELFHGAWLLANEADWGEE